MKRSKRRAPPAEGAEPAQAGCGSNRSRLRGGRPVTATRTDVEAPLPPPPTNPPPSKGSLKAAAPVKVARPGRGRGRPTPSYPSREVLSTTDSSDSEAAPSAGRRQQ